MEAQYPQTGSIDHLMPRDLKSIQFLRFAAASIVVFIHSIEAISKYVPNGVPYLERYIGIGASGVSIFFVISGFVMIYTSFRENDRFSASLFFARRVARIYPIYILYALLYLAFYRSFTETRPFSLAEVGASLLLVPGYSSNIIGPGWTLSFEMYFYICFAIFMSFAMSAGLVAMTIYFAAAIALKYLLVTSDPVVYVVTNPLLVEFLLGAWIAYFIIRMPRISPNVGYVALSIAAVGFLVGAAFGNSRWPALIVWGGPSAFLIAGLVIHELGGKASWIVRHLSFLGDSSYSLYLLHIMLLDCFFLTVGPHFDLSNVNPLFLALLFTIMCALISHVAYSHIERRLTTATRRIMCA